MGTRPQETRMVAQLHPNHLPMVPVVRVVRILPIKMKKKKISVRTIAGKRTTKNITTNEKQFLIGL